jgi:DNA-binding transcriptional LysR family regulator
MSFTPLNALSAFVAVARRRSFAAAAKSLGVTASALSQSVRQLEQRLGTPLLLRTSRSVALTDAGQQLLDHAGPAIDQALESLKVIDAQRGEVIGRVRLTVPTSAVTLVLADVLPTFVERHPRVVVEVVAEDRLVNVVAEGLDAGIRLVEAIDRDMVHVRLTGATRVVVAAAPSYLERAGALQKPHDLLKHTCLCVRWARSGEPWAWELTRGKKSWRVPVRGPVVTNDFELIRSLALSGTGLMYTLEARIADDLASGRLRVVLEPYAPHVPGLFLYFPSRTQISPALKAFVAVAREVMNRRSES